MSFRARVALSALVVFLISGTLQLCPGAERRPPSILVTGDILLAGRVAKLIAQEGPTAPFAGVREVLKRADLVMGNLECPLATGGQPVDKQFVFRAHPSAARALAEAGFDIVTLANNHSCDYGPDALLETLRALERHSIVAVGAGRDMRAARLPVVVECGSPPVRVAVLAFSNMLPESFYAAEGKAGTNPARPDAITRDVADARAKADVVIVLLHSGEELSSSPTPVQRRLARAAVDAGADLVVGHHPHLLQGVEARGHGVIAYSVGNFCFPSRGEAARTAILRYSPQRDGGARVELIPCLIDDFRPRLASGPARAAVIAHLVALSRQLGTHLSPRDASLTLPPRAASVDNAPGRP